MEKENRVKLELAVDELNELISQVWSVNNVLHLLYDFLSEEDKEISGPASAMLVCMLQLDYVCQKTDKLLDSILECSNIA